MTQVLVVDDVPDLAEQYAYDLKRVGKFDTLVAAAPPGKKNAQPRGPCPKVNGIPFMRHWRFFRPGEILKVPIRYWRDLA